MNKILKEIGKIGIMAGVYYGVYKICEARYSIDYTKILSKRQISLIDKTFIDLFNISGEKLLSEVRFRLQGKHPGINLNYEAGNIASYVITKGGDRFIVLTKEADVVSIVHELTHHLQYTRKILAEEELNFQANTFKEYWECKVEVQARETARYFRNLAKMS